MKKIIKGISLFLICLMTLSVFGCKDKNDNSNKKEIILPVIDTEQEADKYLIKDFSSAYKIVIPENASSIIKTASTEMQLFLQESSGVTLPIITDKNISYNLSNKYISLGDTTILNASGIVNDYQVLKDSGYKINTKGQQLIISGATDVGVVYGVYGLLDKLIDFEAYAIDEVYYKKKTTLFVLDFKDFTHIPAIDNKHMMDPSVSSLNVIVNLARMGVISSSWTGTTLEGMYFGGGLNVHSTLKVLDPEKYPDKKDWFNKERNQLCLSNQEMIDEFIIQLEKVIEGAPNSKYYNLGNWDNRSVCTCDRCNEYYQKYGSARGATTIYCQFLNKVQAAVDSWLLTTYPERYGKVFIGGLAYFGYVTPPVIYDEKNDTYTPTDSSVVLNDHVFIQFATHDSCMAHSLDDENCDHNKSFYRNFLGWASICKHLKIYTYNACMDELLMPFNNFGSIKGNCEVWSKYGVDYVFYEGNKVNNAPFDRLKQYVFSKLSDDPTLDYNALVNDFMQNYYKVASEEISTYYRLLRDNFIVQAKENNANICIGLYTYNPYMEVYKNDKTYWPYHFLNQSKTLFEKAYNKIENSGYSLEDKETLKTRVLSLELSNRFFLLKYYSAYYDNLAEEKARFYSDADKLGWNTSSIFSSSINF